MFIPHKNAGKNFVPTKLTWDSRYSEKRGLKKNGVLILNKEIEVPVNACIGVEEDFVQSLFDFLLAFFGNKKE